MCWLRQSCCRWFRTTRKHLLLLLGIWLATSTFSILKFYKVTSHRASWSVFEDPDELGSTFQSACSVRWQTGTDSPGVVHAAAKVVPNGSTLLVVAASSSGTLPNFLSQSGHFEL
mmetsp:Transcript_7997/g.27398  ORF Transcript_7997/g.27398 Transcript_7997/m.27398 type:complete len:115 (-) Transcript_7997:1355-1699(-)